MNDFDKDFFQNLTVEQITTLVDECKKELNSRNEIRRSVLIQNLCNAVNTLVLEFPDTKLNMRIICNECSHSDDVNIMDFLYHDRKLRYEDFTFNKGLE